MARKDQLDEELEIVDETDVSEVEDEISDEEAEEILNSLSDEELEELKARASVDEADTIDEAADGTGGVPEGASKTNLLSIAMKKLGSATPDQIAGFYKSLEKFNPGIPDDAASKNQASIAMKESIQEDLANVFGDNQELSEEFKTKVSTLFESALAIKEETIRAEIEDAYDKKLEESVNEILEDFTDKIDSYLSYVAEEFVKENELAIESSIRTDLSESFIQGLYNLFAEHHVSVPEEDIEITELLSNKINELEEQLDASINSNIEAAQVIKEYEKDAVISEKLAGLTQVQADKFIKLAESIEFNDADEFSNKLDIIKESNFVNNAEKKTNLLNEEAFTEDDDETEQVINDPTMRRYVDATKRTVKQV